MGSTFPFVPMEQSWKEQQSLRRKGVYMAEPWSEELEDAGFCS